MIFSDVIDFLGEGVGEIGAVGDDLIGFLTAVKIATDDDLSVELGSVDLLLVGLKGFRFFGNRFGFVSGLLGLNREIRDMVKSELENFLGDFNNLLEDYTPFDLLNENNFFDLVRTESLDELENSIDAWVDDMKTQVESGWVSFKEEYGDDLITNNAEYLFLNMQSCVSDLEVVSMLKSIIKDKNVECPETMENLHDVIQFLQWGSRQASNLFDNFVRSIPFSNEYFFNNLVDFRLEGGELEHENLRVENGLIKFELNTNMKDTIIKQRMNDNNGGYYVWYGTVIDDLFIKTSISIKINNLKYQKIYNQIKIGDSFVKNVSNLTETLHIENLVKKSFVEDIVESGNNIINKEVQDKNLKTFDVDLNVSFVFESHEYDEVKFLLRGEEYNPNHNENIRTEAGVTEEYDYTFLSENSFYFRCFGGERYNQWVNDNTILHSLVEGVSSVINGVLHHPHKEMLLESLWGNIFTFEVGEDVVTMDLFSFLSFMESDSFTNFRKVFHTTHKEEIKEIETDYSLNDFKTTIKEKFGSFSFGNFLIYFWVNRLGINNFFNEAHTNILENSLREPFENLSGYVEEVEEDFIQFYEEIFE